MLLHDYNDISAWPVDWTICNDKLGCDLLLFRIMLLLSKVVLFHRNTLQKKINFSLLYFGFSFEKRDSFNFFHLKNVILF